MSVDNQPVISTDTLPDAPQIVDPSQDDATMVEPEANLEKEGLS